MNGRIIEDTDPILKIRNPMADRDPKTGEILEKKGVLSWLWGNKTRSATGVAVDTHALHFGKVAREEEEKKKAEALAGFIDHQKDDSSAFLESVSTSQISGEDLKTFHTVKSSLESDSR